MQNTNRNTPFHQWIVICLALFAFGMSAYLSRTVFERLPHLEDEVAYLFQARVYAHGDLVIPSPELRRAFWQPFVVDRDGLRFSKYTPGWSAQLAVGVLLGETWVINAFYAALTVAVTYRLGREIFNPETGVIAAALFAFSPMALLLNATLMGHTSALFWTTLFLYAYWRLERGRRALWWGALAGIALGLLVASRPLTGLAVALPVIVWSVIRLVRAVAEGVRRRTEVKGLRTEKNDRTGQRVAEVQTGTEASLLLSPQSSVLSTLLPLLVLGAITLVIGLSVPLYNNAAVGDPFANLYRLVWDYDRIGFGTGYGRNGHTLQKAYNHSRFDLSLTAADLFGWQIGTITDENDSVEPDIVTQLTTEADYWLRIGVSWVLIPFGLIVAFRRRTLAVFAWFAVLYAWIRFAPEFQGGAQMTNPYFAWIWVFAAFAWLFAPFLVMRDRRTVWSWILVAVTLSVIGFQLTYWIGSQRYSTRYYYEALTAVCIISALPVAWLMKKSNELRVEAKQRGKPLFSLITRYSSLITPLIALAFAALLLYSLFAYSLPRIGVLRGFNNVNQSWIAQVEERAGDQPALVIINGSNVRWRAYGSLMASTSPYLDSPIIAAWNFNGSEATRERLLSLFPDRLVIDMDAEEAQATFRDTPVAQGQ